MADDIARVVTRRAPKPAGHYAQATVWRDLVSVSGQLPIDPDDGLAPSGDFETQAARALANLLAILSEAGSGPQAVLKVTAYVVGVENWPTFDRAFAAAFGASRPARAVVPVPELHHGYLVEVEATAVRIGAHPGDKTTR